MPRVWTQLANGANPEENHSPVCFITDVCQQAAALNTALNAYNLETRMLTKCFT